MDVYTKIQYMYVWMSVCICVCIRMCMIVHINVCICICMYVCLYVYLCERRHLFITKLKFHYVGALSRLDYLSRRSCHSSNYFSVMMYAKASSDDTAKHKTCINNAKQCKTNPEKNAQKTQKQVTEGCLGMQKKANKMRKKTHLSTKQMQKTCTKHATKMHQKGTNDATKMHNKCKPNATQMQSNSKTNAIKHVLVFAFAIFLLCICVLFAFFFCIFCAFP